MRRGLKNNPTGPKDLTMLSEVLQNLIDTGKTTVVELASIAFVTKQTVYNWLAGKGNPSEVAIRQWMCPHSPEAVRAAVLREMTLGQASFAQPASDCVDLDFNGDGKVNLADAMLVTMRHEKAAHATLEVVYQALERDPNSITTHDFEALIANNQAAIAHMKAIDKIVSQEVSRRRQARPIKMSDVG